MGGEVLLHATCVSIGGHGVLLLGAPGAGKSDLALRLIDGGAMLVSDDQVLVIRRGGELLAAPPARIAGRLEMRGFGILEMPFVAGVPLKLAVTLAPAATIERLPAPEDARCDVLGVALAQTWIDPASASAAPRVRAALAAVLKGPQNFR